MVFNHYISLVYDKEIERADFLAGYDIEAHIMSYPLCMNHAVSRELAKRCGKNIAEFMEACIEEDYYIHCLVDTYYIHAYEETCGASHFMHNILLYGYDGQNRIFYAADCFTEGKYSFAKIPYEEFEHGFTISGFDWLEGIRLIKKREAPHIGIWYDIPHLKEQINYYIKGSYVSSPVYVDGMTAYGCSDVNLTAINNVSEYIRRDVQLNNSQECMARYYNGSQYAYFNCYLWALNILVVDKTTFDVGQIAMNEIGVMGTPGYWCNDIRRLKTGDKLNQVEGYVKRDLTALKYKVYSITQTTPSYSLSRHALAFKLRTNPWDYHFMRLQKGEGKWSFKAGWKGPAFWINGKTPNQVIWTEYKCYYSRPVWENTGVSYNSALWYITYK